ncbi:hypothetical protein [uncultured Campylobacter sp.]|nr:hypothetical protein [uncultured Campylobacter sp.]
MNGEIYLSCALCVALKSALRGYRKENENLHSQLAAAHSMVLRAALKIKF